MKLYQLELLSTEEISRWDELIAPFPNRYVFHQKAWLEYVEASQNAEIRFWAIREASRTVGYFPGGIIRKGPYRILGSPLKGWCTNFMGPIFSDGFDHDAFFRAIDVLAKRERLDMVEIEQPALAKQAFVAHGFEPVSCPNLVVRLEAGQPQKMWEQLDSKVRTKVRKAKRSGLKAEVTADPGIAEVYNGQLLRRLIERKKSPQIGSRNARLLCEYLMPRDLILAICVRDPQGQIVATALCPHDENTLYGWGSSSRSDAWGYSVNEYVEWTAMELAATRALKFYNIGSYGRFSSKFGGELQETIRWHKFYCRTARLARSGYEVFHRTQIQMPGWWKKFVGSDAGV